MLNNILIACLLPWLISIPWIRKQPLLFLVITPVTIATSMLFNTVGFYFNFWNVVPYIAANETIAGMPFDFGIYPVLASFMVYTINRVNTHPFYIVLLYSLLTTLLEYIAYLMKIVSYGSNWTIGWTFVSYLLAFSCVAIYARLLRLFINPLLR